MLKVNMVYMVEGEEREEVTFFKTSQEVERYKKAQYENFNPDLFDSCIVSFDVKKVSNELSCEVSKRDASLLKLYCEALGVKYEPSACGDNIIFSFTGLDDVQINCIECFLEEL